MIRLLLIDDRPDHRALFKQLLIGSATPWLRDVQIDAVGMPPPLSEILAYDGAVIDYRLIGPSNGYEIVRELHARDWSFPTMLLTGEPMLLPQDTMLYASRVASKELRTVTVFDPCDPLTVARAFLREIAKAKKATP